MAVQLCENIAFRLELILPLIDCIHKNKPLFPKFSDGVGGPAMSHPPIKCFAWADAQKDPESEISCIRVFLSSYNALRGSRVFDAITPADFSHFT